MRRAAARSASARRRLSAAAALGFALPARAAPLARVVV